MAAVSELVAAVPAPPQTAGQAVTGDSTETEVDWNWRAVSGASVQMIHPPQWALVYCGAADEAGHGVSSTTMIPHMTGLEWTAAKAAGVGRTSGSEDQSRTPKFPY